jgi:hypothetical protein
MNELIFTYSIILYVAFESVWNFHKTGSHNLGCGFQEIFICQIISHRGDIGHTNSVMHKYEAIVLWFVWG